MEQGWITGLYKCLGLSVGEEFSTEDVTQLYRKVFHVPSDTDEAQTAMMKIAGGDSSWFCMGENVLDVLLEMDRERKKKEKLYWDLQLLNMGNHLSTLHAIDTPHIMDPQMLYQKNTLNVFKIGLCQRDPIQPRTVHTNSLQWEQRVGKKAMQWNARDVKRLKKAHRQCWARLVVEGVQSILPPAWQGQRTRGHAWGYVSSSDVLLLLEVKYDVVTHMLYTEMLQEHYTHSMWKTLLPWQQRTAEEELEDRAEEALDSGDMLRLAELPGALKIYRFQEQSWSAISFLCELNTLRQQEKDTLAALSHRLEREHLTLLCLYIRFATLKAQRQKMSYSALLAARQSWETWPYVNIPMRAEQAALWLQCEGKEQKEAFISVVPKQHTALELLVLNQEEERMDLVKLVHGISLRDLQGIGGCTEPPKEENSQYAALRNGCIKRLQEIYASLKTHTGSRTPPLKDCVHLLLMHLMELQEVQASVLLPELMDKCDKDVREEYESELQVQRLTNLLQLLTSDAPLGSWSTQLPNSNITQNSSNEQITTHSCCRRTTGGQTINAAEGEAVEGARVQTTDDTDKQDVCTGCEAFMEDLPYLEILCVSDANSNTHRGLNPERGAVEVEEVGTTTNAQSYEKQGSLITLAWSKPLDEGNDCYAETAPGSMLQTQHEESITKTEVQPSDLHDTSGTQSADQTCSTEQVTVTESPVTDQAVKGEWMSECETLQVIQPALLTDSPKMDTADSLSSTSSETADMNHTVEEEVYPTAADSQVWCLRDPEQAPTDCSDTALHSSSLEREVMRESTQMERERAREAVSAVERERTMRNLVDMQKKVEQKQQRDKERQLLRVQEHLSIIQNRKAEEDLLGLKHTDRFKHLTQDLPQDDKNQQKTVVRERLDQLRRERSYVMQSKRDKNTAGFKELLGPVAQQSREVDDTD